MKFIFLIPDKREMEKNKREIFVENNAKFRPLW